MRVGTVLGPVFTYESMIASRRWQTFATRSGFVAVLLLCLASVWSEDRGRPGMTPRQRLAMAGQGFSAGTTVVSLALVLLAAPATTAGAVCLDKARGTLAHLLTTDLTDAEVVVGKLVARLLPVLALLACALPVSSIAVWLGGVDPIGLFGSFLVAGALAGLGCSLGMLLSVRGTKPHEVLTVAYLIWVVWLVPIVLLALLPGGIGTGAGTWKGRAIDGYLASHPFWVALNPRPRLAGPWVPPTLWPALRFAGGALALSLALTGLAIRSLRPSLSDGVDRKDRTRIGARISGRFLRAVPWWPSPTLDRNPVLWREWHRSRPSRWTRVAWGLYLGAFGLASVAVIARVALVARGRSPDVPASLVAALGSTLGLLLMSLTSVTSLAEERVRGSLDILLATPMSTRSIVWGKWLGTFRLTPLVLACPVAICYALAVRSMPDASVASFYALAAYGLAWGAFVASLGLGLALWTRRLGRAIAMAVVAFGVLTIGPLFLNGGRETPLLMGSPLAGMSLFCVLIEVGSTDPEFLPFLKGGSTWAAAYGAAALGLLVAVVLTFDRTLGRSPERPRRARRSPLGAGRGPSGPLTGSGSRTPGAAGRPARSGGSCARRPR